MNKIKIQCRNCSAFLAVPATSRGKRMLCPKCNVILSVKPAESVLAQNAPPDEKMKRLEVQKSDASINTSSRNSIQEHATKKCPSCGKPIHEKAKKCKHCRNFLHDNNEPMELVDLSLQRPNGVYSWKECSFCGQENPDSNSTCTYCGTAFTQSVGNLPDEDVAESPTYFDHAAVYADKRRRIDSVRSISDLSDGGGGVLIVHGIAAVMLIPVTAALLHMFAFVPFFMFASRMLWRFDNLAGMILWLIAGILATALGMVFANLVPLPYLWLM